MQREGLRNEIRRIILLSSLLLVVGLFLGYPVSALLIGAGAYLAFTLNKIIRIYKWLSDDARDLPPDSRGVWGDITEYIYKMRRKNDRVESNLDELLDRIRKITTALDDGLILLTPEQALDRWNPAAANMLKFRVADRGQHITNLFRDPRFVRFMQAEKFDSTLELPSPFETSRILQFSAGTFGDNELVLVVRDITRLRHLEQMRKDFVGNISHELRTPLTVLMGYIETLNDDPAPVPPGWRRALEHMQQQTDRMNNLAEDLVLLSRLESTPAPAGKSLVDIGNLLGDIVEGAALLCEETHRISLECEPDLAIPGEAKELYSAFSNLVFNAIKHNPEGCDITIQAKTGSRGLAIRFADNGTGIDPRHLPRLTERFYRVDSSRATSSGGTGLGLAIVKHVLIRHRGHLEIRSTLGKGSIFTCLFDQPQQPVIANNN